MWEYCDAASARVHRLPSTERGPRHRCGPVTGLNLQRERLSSRRWLKRNVPSRGKAEDANVSLLHPSVDDINGMKPEQCCEQWENEQRDRDGARHRRCG
jgi:hypothetical protein